MSNHTEKSKNSKQECRILAHKIRAIETQKDKNAAPEQSAAQRIGEVFFQEFPDVTGKIIAGYAAIRSEIDVWPLLKILEERGAQLALPFVWQKDCWLKFLSWRSGDVLREGAFGVAVPDPASREMIPDIILLPLLGFSHHGIRLGYGGGYYDRTIDKLCKQEGRKIALIGIAYQMQRFDELPFDENDCRLDTVLTEKGVIRFV